MSSPQPKARSGIARYVPILSWLPSYDPKWLAFDVVAGLTLWGLVVPEAMAYAGIAGLPPQAGLYTILAAFLVYALLGSSRDLSVGPTSATAALLASSVAAALVASAAANASDPKTYQPTQRPSSWWSASSSWLPGWRGWDSSPSSCPSP